MAIEIDKEKEIWQGELTPSPHLHLRRDPEIKGLTLFSDHDVEAARMAGIKDRHQCSAALLTC